MTLSGRTGGDTAPVLTYRNVRKLFGQFVALNDVSMQVNRGEVGSGGGDGGEHVCHAHIIMDGKQCQPPIIEYLINPCDTLLKGLELLFRQLIIPRKRILLP